MRNGTKTSVIIPCYNEERTIGEVLERVCRIQLEGSSTEIIVVNDGSQDNTREILDAFDFPSAVSGRVYHAPTNLGKGASLRAGMALATGDVIAFQDADLELDPEELPRLIRPVLRHEADVVYGSRFLGNHNTHIPRSSRLANRALSTATRLLFGGSVTDMETAYKVFSREVAERLRLRCVRFDIEPEITAKILRLGFRIVEVPVSYSPRSVQMGKKIGWSDGVEAIYTLLRLRFAPLSACQCPRRAAASEAGSPAGAYVCG